MTAGLTKLKNSTQGAQQNLLPVLIKAKFLQAKNRQNAASDFGRKGGFRRFQKAGLGPAFFVPALLILAVKYCSACVDAAQEAGDAFKGFWLNQERCVPSVGDGYSGKAAMTGLHFSNRCS